MNDDNRAAEEQTRRIRVETRIIGPEEAAELLVHNTRNRNARHNQVTRMAEDMLEGRWRENGETIKIAADGTLIDGQHRLLAIVKSGARLPMMIVSGLHIEAQETIDIGAARTAADALRFDGMSQVTRLAAVARAVIMYTQRIPFPSHPMVVEFARAEADTLSLATDLAVRVHTDIGGGVAVYGTAAHVLMEVSVSDAIDFMEMMAGEIGVSRGHPVHALRLKFKQLGRARMAKSITALDQHVAFMIKAWNLCVDGQDASLIRVGDTERETLTPKPPKTPLSVLRAEREGAQ